MLQEDYRVTLDAFQGPLDLLLYLIRRLEIDITEIPIATITDQYLAFLMRVEDVDVELAGEFLVMAATLVELKSRTLMPAERTGEDGAAADDGGPSEPKDPGFELVQQLLAYQRFRLAAEALDDRRFEFAQRFPCKPAVVRDRGEDEGAEPVELELEDAHVMDLTEAYERIMASIDFDRLGDHVVAIDDTPIALHQADLIDRLERAGTRRLALQDVFSGRSRGERVGLFLATLELARLRRLDVKQEDIDAEIELVLVTDESTVGL